VALARPGCVVVTACVQALPTPQQKTDGTTPRASLSHPLWFALEPGTEPEPDDDAVCTREPVMPETMPLGSITTLRITMQNMGTSTWTGADGYRLGRLLNIPDAGAGFGPDFVDLPQPSVEPLGFVTFTVPVTASEAGTVKLSWRMIHDRYGELRKWFGAATVETVLNVPPAPATDGAGLAWHYPLRCRAGGADQGLARGGGALCQRVSRRRCCEGGATGRARAGDGRGR
jgi:hypothetical protein